MLGGEPDPPPGLNTARNAAGPPERFRLHHPPFQCPSGHWEQPVITGAHLVAPRSRPHPLNQIQL
eukprot:7550211-Alexandrium_andersonii.AAC.1